MANYTKKEKPAAGLDLTKKVIGIEQPKEPETYVYMKYSNTQGQKKKMASRNPFILTCIDVVKVKDKMRTICLVEGESTIFRDEMSEDTQKEIKTKGVKKLKFYNNVLQVSRHDKLTLEYLNLSDNNASKEGRDPHKATLFQLYAPQKAAVKSLDEDRLKTKAKQYIYDTAETQEGLDRLVRFAEVLGIATSNSSYGEVKLELIRRAEMNPQKFLDELKNPNNKNKEVILEAIKARIIKKVENRIQWTDSNTDLVVAPIGIDPVDLFVSKSFDELKPTFIHLEEKLMQTAPLV